MIKDIHSKVVLILYIVCMVLFVPCIYGISTAVQGFALNVDAGYIPTDFVEWIPQENMLASVASDVTAEASQVIDDAGDRIPTIEVQEEIQEEPVCPISEAELDLFAKCVWAESGNQPEEGIRLVIDTLWNRVDCPYFDDTITEVIMHPGQFEVVSKGSIYKATPTEEIYEWIVEEYYDRLNDEVLYFTAGHYNPSGSKWKQVGAHYFSYIKKAYAGWRNDYPL